MKGCLILTTFFVVIMAVISNEVFQYFPDDCNTSVQQLFSKQSTTVIFSTNSSVDSHLVQNCVLQFTLEKSTSIYSTKKSDVLVELDFTDLCDFELNVLSDVPSENEPIATLSCWNNSSRSWRGQVPYNYLVLQFRLHNNDTSVSQYDAMRNYSVKLWYDKCFDFQCYQTSKYYYTIRRNQIKDFCSKRVCIDNEKTRFSNDEEYSIFCPKCRSIEFNVIEDVQLCVKGSDIRFRKGSYRQSCGITVDVDERRVLTLREPTEGYFCLPWTLYGRSVKFTFGNDDKWNCLDSTLYSCRVWIITNSTQSYSSACKEKTTTTTKSWYAWSSWSSDYDDKDPEPDMTAVYMVAIVGCILTCVCAGVCKLVSVGKRSNAGTTNIEMQQTDSNRLTNSRGAIRSPLVDGAPYSNDHDITQQPTPRDPLLGTRSTWQNNENPQFTLTLSVNDSAGRNSVPDEEHFRNSSAPPPSYDSQINNDPDEPNFRHFPAPPPSYEEVCKGYQTK